ncbi:MAG: hypothetical protein IPJ32_19510 [Sphingobacteriaceae bacterium]|nr:hypothetical protein [Sphingobacteriaceae bacterium]
MEITFDKIHETVLEALELQQEHSAFFKVIGKWYYDFLKSSEKKLTLHVPKYEVESLNIVYNYTRLFSLVYRLSQRPELIAFENTCLFNVFDYNKKRTLFLYNTKSTIDFVKQEGDTLFWSDNTIISKDRFIPVFVKNQIENSHWEDIFNSFKLFKIIERNGLINYPILINFKEDLCLSISNGEDISAEEFIQFKTLNWDSKMYSQEDAIAFEEELVSKDFTHQITIKYPYHKNIHSYLFDLGNSSLHLIFNSRFYYKNLTEEDLFLLPNELHGNELLLKDFPQNIQYSTQIIV